MTTHEAKSWKLMPQIAKAQARQARKVRGGNSCVLSLANPSPCLCLRTACCPQQEVKLAVIFAPRGLYLQQGPSAASGRKSRRKDLIGLVQIT